MDDRQLVGLACAARSRAYAPYSGFSAGAALLDADGRVGQGCHIENAAVGPTVCAERVALFKAVSEGVRSFEALAVVGGPAGEEIAPYTTPCGVCRQVLREFCSDGFRVILASSDGSLRTTTLGELLPQGFGPENLT